MRLTDMIRDPDFILNLLEEIVDLGKNYPDYRYPCENGELTCRYNGPPAGVDAVDCDGCIIGVALQRLGWDDEREMRSAKTIRTLLQKAGMQYVPEILSVIQLEHDHGYTWSQVAGMASHNLQWSSGIGT